MYTIVNTTCRPVAVAVDAFEEREVLVYHQGIAVRPVRVVRNSTIYGDSAFNPQEKDTKCYLIPASGYHVKCEAYRTGPAVGCQVDYTLTKEDLKKIRDVRSFFYNQQGSQLLLASYISARVISAAGAAMTDGTSILTVYPVLAAESLQLPITDRWADGLGTFDHLPSMASEQSIRPVAAHY